MTLTTERRPNDDGAPPRIEMRGITKYFGAVTALDDVNLALNAGEVLGVVGDNGAGKTTLMKVLSGVHKPSKGELLVDGVPRQLRSPRDAHNFGIEMVYQDLALAGNLSITENIFLGREPTRQVVPGVRIVDRTALKQLSAEHLARLKIQVKSVTQPVEELSGGQRQAVAIARATAFDAKVVIMDEPTAALAIKEVGKVLDLIRHLKELGVSIILVSHRMDVIYSVCDRVVALYHGENFAEGSLPATDRKQVIAWIMGSSDAPTAVADLN